MLYKYLLKIYILSLQYQKGPYSNITEINYVTRKSSIKKSITGYKQMSNQL